MRLLRKTIPAILLSCVLLSSAAAQDNDSIVVVYAPDTDTTVIESIPPVYVSARRKGKEWRKYYRLVHNFAKTYPYALVAKEKLEEADSNISGMQKRKQNRYINSFQDELFATFEKPLRDLTISQGKLLLRLIDREAGLTSYNIVKDYKGKVAAGFWQGVAKLFGSDMKRPYDKDGEDRQTEELVILYQKGEFNRLYRSVFGKNPPEPAVRPKKDYPQK